VNAADGVHAPATRATAERAPGQRADGTVARDRDARAGASAAGEVGVRSSKRVEQIIKGAFRPFNVSISPELWGKQLRFRVIDERGHTVLERKALRMSDFIRGPKLIRMLNACRTELEKTGYILDPWTLPVQEEGGVRPFSRHDDRPHAP